MYSAYEILKSDKYLEVLYDSDLLCFIRIVNKTIKHAAFGMFSKTIRLKAIFAADPSLMDHQADVLKWTNKTCNMLNIHMVYGFNDALNMFNDSSIRCWRYYRIGYINQVVFEYYWIRNSFQYYANHVNCLQSGSF